MSGMVEIRNADGAAAELWLYDEIGPTVWGENGITAAGVRVALESVTAPVLDVRVNSPGGSVFEGLAIHTLLARHSARVRVHVDGLAASIASVVAMAGDEIIMAPGAMMMVHNAWGWASGQSGDLRAMADTLDKVSGQLAGVYAGRTGLDVDRVASLMAAETWMTGAEAVAAGFADRVVDVFEPAGVAARASFDLARVAARYRYRRAPVEDVAGAGAVPAAGGAPAHGGPVGSLFVPGVGFARL